MIIRSHIPPNYRGLTILEYLTKRFTYLSKDDWGLRILENRISVNESIVDCDYIVQPKDNLVYNMPDFIEPPADLNFSIVYENDDFLAVNKTGNLLVHRQGKSLRSNLIYQLRECFSPTYPTADIVNRLDRETSGIVLVSKSKEVLKEMNLLFVNREIKKSYYAIVEGTLDQLIGTINKPLGKDTNNSITYKQIIREDGKEAITDYEVIRSNEKYSLLDVSPKTGRTHQIRVHLASIGAVIAGDKLYGMNQTDYIKWRDSPKDYPQIIPARQALHCYKLEFLFRGKLFKITAPIPDDMSNLLK